MTVFTDKMEAAGIDLETARGWERELRDKLGKARTRRSNAEGSITNATNEKAAAIAEITRLREILGVLE